MAEYGDFDGDFDAYKLFSDIGDSDDDFLGTINLDEAATLFPTSTVSNYEKFKLDMVLKQPEVDVPMQTDNNCSNQPAGSHDLEPLKRTVSELRAEQEAGENPGPDGDDHGHDDGDAEDPKPKRFKTVTDEELLQFKAAHQSSSTKRNTIWGMKIFQDWNIEANGSAVNMEEVGAADLAELLGRFYCEAKPQAQTRRDGELLGEYHKNTLKNIRAAIKRHVQDLDRNIDIVNDKEFINANKVLDGMLKQRMQTGTSRATKHKDVIEDTDLEKISKYFQDSSDSPLVLRYSVWYNLSLQFVTRGLEFHHQLKLDSFEFHTDQHGEYVTMSHECQQKNFQGGLKSQETPTDKRMYATNDDTTCPVKILKTLINKTNPKATHLFNQLTDSKKNPSGETNYWFGTKPLAKRSFSNFLKDICKGAGIEKPYTAHCLRTTAIQNMNDAGYEARHIMFMSGHRSEASLRTYNRSCSSTQKKTMSETLSRLATGTGTSMTMSSSSGIKGEKLTLSETNANKRSPTTMVPLGNTKFDQSTFTGCSFIFNKQ